MEKYRAFADGSTGVNPFVPTWSHHKTALPVRALKFLVLFPFAIFKLVLFTAAMLWIAVAELICSLIFVDMVRYPIYRLLSSIGCGVSLLALGMMPGGDELGDYKRLKLAAPKTKSAGRFVSSRGTLVFANQQSFMDVLFLGHRIGPVFVFIASDGTPVQYWLLGALRRAAVAKLPPPPAKPTTLEQIAKAAESAYHQVVVFPEGANTNGSCVLSWKPKTVEGMSSLEKPVGVALVSVTYSKTGSYSPHHTVGTPLQHLFWLAYTPYHIVGSVWLPPDWTAEYIKGKALAEQWAFLRMILTRLAKGVVEVDVPAERHGEFLAFWDSSQQKGYTKQQEKQEGGTKDKKAGGTKKKA